jgi:hypothetical protein
MQQKYSGQQQRTIICIVFTEMVITYRPDGLFRPSCRTVNDGMDANKRRRYGLRLAEVRLNQFQFKAHKITTPRICNEAHQLHKKVKTGK